MWEFGGICENNKDDVTFGICVCMDLVIDFVNKEIKILVCFFFGYLVCRVRIMTFELV